MARLLAAAHSIAGSGTPGWTIAAVVVAAGTALFVGWQALESHRATSGSAQALRASQAIAVDNARARLDQNAPRAELYVEPLWPPVEPSAVKEIGGQAQPIESTRTWLTPRDAGQFLT